MFGGKKKKEEGDASVADAGAQETQQDASGGSDEQKVGTLVAGDQSIHIFIETVKETNVPENEKMDLKVETICMGQKGYTNEHKNVNKLTVEKFNEHIFLEQRGKSIPQLEKATIEIRLMNVNPIFKNSLVGMYEFDFSNIYFNDDHTMHHQWIALTNPAAEDMGEVQAYMKLSISITATGDKQIELKPDDNADDNCKLPPSIKPKYVQLILKFYKGEHLPRLDTSLLSKSGSMDAYIKFTQGTKKIKTSVKTTKNDEAAWFEAFYIPVQLPVMNGRIALELYDFDTINDELAASMIFDVKELLQKKNGKYTHQNYFFWKNVYGAHEGGGLLSGGNSDYKKLMNTSPELGSCFKGRILMSVEIVETDKVELKCVPLDPKETKKADPHAQNKEYSLIADVGSLIDPPEKKKEYKIKICIGEHQLITDKVANQGHNFNRWNKRFHANIQFPYVDIADIEHIFVYLMDGNSPIAFAKFEATQFTDPSPKLFWTQFKADKAIDSISDSKAHKTGLFSLKMTIVEGTKNQKEFEVKTNPVWHKPMDKRPDIMQVRAFIFQCKDLPAADASGASDPYIEMFDNIEMKDTRKEGKRTQWIEQTLDPMIFQAIDLQLEVNKDKNIKDPKTGRPGLIMPPFIMDVYDHDDGIMDSTDDYLCRAVIPLEESSYIIYDDDDTDKNVPPDPKWHKLRFDSESPVSGEILCSFVIASSDFNWKVPLRELRLYNEVVPFEEYEVEINVLGMRNLASPGILPIKKATVEFRVQSLVPPEVSRQIPNISTEPGPSGPNPTINTNIVFNVPLPVEEKYYPALACRVYDHIFLGGSKQLCGTFNIPLGKLMHEKRAENLNEIAGIEYKIDQLKKILDEVAPMCYNSSRQQSAIDDEDFTSMAKDQKEATMKQFNKAQAASEASSDRDELEKQAVQNQVNDMKKPLLLHQDETDDDEEDNRKTYAPPNLAINSSMVSSKASMRKTTAASHTMPKLDTSKINEESKDGTTSVRSSSSTSRRMKRQMMTDAEKKQQDQEVIEQVLKTPTKRSSTVSKNAHPDEYRPVGTPRRSEDEFDQALREAHGDRGSSAKKMSMDMKVALTKKLASQVRQDVEKEHRNKQAERQQKQHEFESSNDNAFKNIIMPEYELDKRLNRQKGNKPLENPIYREKNVPPKEVFMPLGWDPKPTVDEIKHYRRFYEQGLEVTEQIMEKPSAFDQYEIKKGQSRGNSKSIFGSLFGKKKKDASGQDDTVQIVGKFKGVVICETKEKKKELMDRRNVLISEAFELIMAICKKTTGKELSFTMDDLERGAEERDEFKKKMNRLGLAHLRLLKTFYDLKSEEIMAQQLLIEKKCNVRTYVISAFDLAKKDMFSDSDPYFVLKLGNQEFNDRENYQEDEPSPDLYTIVDFEAKFPGCPQLEIKMYDWDLIFGDELIGSNFIDLEDRFFSPEWQSVPNKPIEYRQLFHPSTTLPQGTVKLWTELIPKEQLGKRKKWNIEKKPFEEYEVRVVIWDTTDLVAMDSEGTTDGFVKAFIDSDGAIKETDTHFRNMDGKCSWNWRMLFRIKHPRSNYKLTIQAYDRDFFSANELIGQDTIDLFPLIEDASLAKRPASLTEDYVNEYPKPETEYTEAGKVNTKDPYGHNLTFDKEDKTQFWMKLMTIDEKNKLISRGNLKVSIDVYPLKDAEDNPVGKGREDPNLNPYLPPPTGRLELSLNPCKMIDQLIDAKTRRKIYCYCCMIAFCALCIMMIPMIFSNMMSEIFLAPFK